MLILSVPISGAVKAKINRLQQPYKKELLMSSVMTTLNELIAMMLLYGYNMALNILT